MGLVRGPGIRDSLQWESRVEFWLQEVAALAGGIGSGGGTGGAAIEALLQQIAGDVADIALLLEGLSDKDTIVRSEREVYECVDLEVSRLPTFSVPPDSFRCKVRITNNSGDGSKGYPVINPCYLIVGYGSLMASPLTSQSWDQIVLPGETIELDAPKLQYSLAVIKHDIAKLPGLISVTNYFEN
jgi:hypothetical protein